MIIVTRGLLLLLIISCAWSQEGATKSAPEIKWMSPEEIQGYLAGHGMGFAKAAELNQHPGPKHVLELAGQLQLTKEQIERTQAVYDQMHAAAVRIGKLYVEKEAEIDQLFLDAKMAEPRLRTLVSEVEKIRGELRFVHLRAHLAMKSLLTQKQIAEYDRLRGYSDSQNKAQHHQHHH